jgi:hypothetical protein
MEQDAFMEGQVEQYRALLNDAVAITHAERGMIVLRSVLTNECAEFLVTCNVDILPAPRSASPRDTYSEVQYLWKMMNEIIGQPEPVLTTNADMDAHYAGHGSILNWTLRSVLAVPLQKQGSVYGLLWCDLKIRQGVLTPDDLARVVALVRRFHAVI